MRSVVLAPFAALLITAWGAPLAAQAQPAPPAMAAAEGAIVITSGPMLRNRSEQIGPREMAELERGLRKAIEQELAAGGGLKPGEQLRLTIVDATPNRPTYREMSTKPGLSFQSFSIGGAEIEGVLISADGGQRPLHYRGYENDLDQAAMAWTWTDAERAFRTFAKRLARGEI